MTATNDLELLTQIYAAYGKGDADMLYAALHPEKFVMTEHSHSAATPWGGPWKGVEGMKAFINSVQAHMTHSAYVCEDVTDAGGGTLIAWGYFETEGNETKNTVKRPWMHKVQFEDGKITQIDEFYDSLHVAEALLDKRL